MENKINIAELLKDCPQGMELDCTMFEGCTLSKVYSNERDTSFPIRIKTENGLEIALTEYGQYYTSKDAKCVIFPKGKTTWEGFKRPFKDGDIIADNHKNIAIYKGKMWYNCNLTDYYCGYRNYDSMFLIKQQKDGHFGVIEEFHFATEEEKQKLFRAIKDNGYKWNDETKKLEKLHEPKFKVGDRIVKKNGICVPILITGIGDEVYYSNTENSVGVFSIKEQDEWELVRDKFNINTLKPYDRVLVRFGSGDIWRINLLERYDETSDNPFLCIGYQRFNQCIPYEGNEHLLGTHNDCPEYYKING